jgi:ADP-L-glycero-D-manno-heptose 6-epimerase
MAMARLASTIAPNEYHKGKMISVVKVKHDELRAGGPIKLFRSDRPGLADGAQARDFIYIDDVVAALRFMLTAPALAGLYNLGTGLARTYYELGLAVCAANSHAANIEFVDMPQTLRGQYQSFTQAPMTRLRETGFNHAFKTLEQGIDTYIRSYLTQLDPYR